MLGVIEDAGARTRAMIDSGQQTITGVNKFRLDEEEDVPVLKVDNYLVRKQQIEKLERLRKERNSAEVDSKLGTLAGAARSGDGNLLALSIEDLVDSDLALKLVELIGDSHELVIHALVGHLDDVVHNEVSVPGEGERPGSGGGGAISALGEGESAVGIGGTGGRLPAI